MMGLVGSECVSLTPELTQNIKQGMAQAYLEALKVIASQNGGYVNRDINAEEVWSFHKTVFEDNGLGIENWTLNIPFTIVKSVDGSVELERLWEDLRETAGEGRDALVGNSEIFLKMEWYAKDLLNGPYEPLAEQWLDLVEFGDIAANVIKQAFNSISEIVNGIGADATLARSIVTLVLEDLVNPVGLSSQQRKISDVASTVNTVETARIYVDGIRRLFFGGSIDETPKGDINSLMVAAGQVSGSTEIPC